MKEMPHPAFVAVPRVAVFVGNQIQVTASLGSPMSEIHDCGLPQGQQEDLPKHEVVPVVKETRPPEEQVLQATRPHILSLDFSPPSIESKRPADQVIEKRTVKVVRFKESPQEEIQDTAKYSAFTQKVETNFNYHSGFRMSQLDYEQAPVYPKWRQNKTSKKTCLFLGCTQTTKRLRDHI